MQSCALEQTAQQVEAQSVLSPLAPAFVHPQMAAVSGIVSGGVRSTNNSSECSRNQSCRAPPPLIPPPPPVQVLDTAPMLDQIHIPPVVENASFINRS